MFFAIAIDRFSVDFEQSRTFTLLGVLLLNLANQIAPMQSPHKLMRNSKSLYPCSKFPMAGATHNKMHVP
jgi:hypothetical protein